MSVLRCVSVLPLFALGLVAGCGQAAPDDGAESVADESQAATTSVIKHVFVIAMENHDASQVYGDKTDAPYINNTLLPKYAHSTNFNDALALSIPSEPHYVFIEGGTNAFSDVTFKTDSDPSKSNSTSSTSHLTTQINNATNGVTWRTYQEGLDSATGTCPIHSSGFYAAKHDPFVFYKDVSGSTPSATNSYCAAHHRAYSTFAGDLSAGDVASYTFITPDLCHDMHGASGCPDSNLVQQGDEWLSSELPRIISYVNANHGVLFVEWDEGDDTLKMPFLAIGPGVKAGYTGTVKYTHGSIVKSIETILDLPVLSTVSSASDLSDLFKSGQYP
jgi:phosphatidylinositol-3-phosphatase